MLHRTCEKDEDGIGHLMVPLRFIADVAGARDIVWLPEHNIPIITFDVNDCGCQMEGRNNEDPCTYKDWEIEIDNVKVLGEPADSSLFSTDGTVPEETIDSSGYCIFDFSIINNNECPIKFIIETPDIGWPSLINIDFINIDPISVRPGEKSEPITMEFELHARLDEILEILRFRLVYEKGEYVERENSIKTVIARGGRCCKELDYLIDINFDDGYYCFYPDEEATGFLEIENNCRTPIWVKIIPSEYIKKHNFPDEIIKLNSAPDRYTKIPFSFTVPDSGGEEELNWFNIQQVDENGDTIGDCEKEFRLSYCEEED